MADNNYGFLRNFVINENALRMRSVIEFVNTYERVLALVCYTVRNRSCFRDPSEKKILLICIKERHCQVYSV